MSDLHLPQKMIIFAVGKVTMCFPFFYASYCKLKRKKSAPHLAFTEKQNNGCQLSMSIITKTFNCFFAVPNGAFHT